MTERIIENASIKINNVIEKCLKREINTEEAKKETTNIMNVIVTEYNKMINNEYLNEIHIIMSKIIFSKDIEIIIVELNKINEIMRKLIINLTDISSKIDWYAQR